MFTSFVHNLKKKFKCLRGGNNSQIRQYQSASSSSWSVSALCFKADDLRAGSPMKVDCCQPPTQSLTQQWQTDAAISLKVSPPVSPDSRWLSSSSSSCWQCVAVLVLMLMMLFCWRLKCHYSVLASLNPAPHNTHSWSQHSQIFH